MTLVRPADPAAIAEAAQALRAGRLVAFPTETVYGLGGDARAPGAVTAIYATKKRPSRNPLIVHVPDLAAAAALCRVSPLAERLAEALWPGPLTLVLPLRDRSPLAPQVTAGGTTVAVRAPAHPVARALLAACDVPLAAPSANRSGSVSPTRAAHVAVDLALDPDMPPDAAPLAMILDGGPCRVGVESTVLDLSGPVPRLLRPGGVTVEALTAILGAPPDSAALFPARRPKAGDAPARSGPPPLPSPGLLTSHYAPARPVRLNAAAASPGEALLGFGGTPGATLDLSPAGDLEEAARNLFAMLRALDRPPHTGIAVAPLPTTGLGATLNDRLTRAAAPRDRND
ncbi:L-threonylcarbamoyladenylate synthase [Roseospira visakhapatnamensis]|uniref:Threonylcarbamoyl-AMP synthase n=1 Tax=Roseospira visakhapatnamensis TaxID=390880 RepID=A0A7W6WBJ0_9PROT|nr:L-threonylcarbamoyladenylate synthase [Roseospira visakhapatnamensis]